MATDKRQRQRARRQVAQQRARVTESRGRIRSRGVRVALIAAVIVVAVLILWLVVRDDGSDDTSGDAAIGETAQGDGADAAPGTGGFPDLPPAPGPRRRADRGSHSVPRSGGPGVPSDLL